MDQEAVLLNPHVVFRNVVVPCASRGCPCRQKADLDSKRNLEVLKSMSTKPPCLCCLAGHAATKFFSDGLPPIPEDLKVYTRHTLVNSVENGPTVGVCYDRRAQQLMWCSVTIATIWYVPPKYCGCEGIFYRLSSEMIKTVGCHQPNDIRLMLGVQ